VTGGVRPRAASVYHTSAHYRNFEEYEDSVATFKHFAANHGDLNSVAFNSDLRTVSGKEVTVPKRLLYLCESTEMHFKPHVFM
jgi:hypothetical protein